LIPLSMWGTHYAAPRNPPRGGELEVHVWRVYSGADNVEFTLEPPLEGPHLLRKMGDYVELTFPAGTSVVFEADGPIMPVAYIVGVDLGAPDDARLGDPAMYQVVPVDQYLSRYALVTGIDFDVHYLQIVRPVGGAPVRVDDVEVTGFQAFGEFEFSDWEVQEGGHTAISDEPFGVTQIGYSGAVENGLATSSYASPGGMRTELIYVP
jgi:hypothetical protein